MTVGELEERMGTRELAYWKKFSETESWERERAN